MSGSSIKDEKRDKAVALLWKRGNLTWKLDTNQKEMYDFIHKKNEKIVVIGCSRRLGKTFFLCVCALEFCLKKPNTIVKFIAPTVKDLRKIIAPTLRDIMVDCPKDLTPSYVKDDHIYRFKNGSEIQLAGTDNGHADSIRGTSAAICFIDEAAFCSELNYVVNSILIPTTTLTRGKIVMASTPPKTLNHPFMGFMQKAEANGALVKKTIYDNPRLTPEDIDELAQAIGGKDSVDFKREYLVELLPDINEVVVPEFTRELQSKIVKEMEKPPKYSAYVSMDIGVKDLTVILFAYYNYRAGILYVEKELTYTGKEVVTDNIARDIADVEAELWLSEEPIIKRISDNNNLLLLNDLQIKHNLTFLPSAKDNNEAAINNLRLYIKNMQVFIHPRCKTLINHLENAIWNKSRNSYARMGGHHFDALDALKMMCRNVDFAKNPYPHFYELDKSKDYFKREEKEQLSPFDKSLKDIFLKKRIKTREKRGF